MGSDVLRSGLILPRSVKPFLMLKKAVAIGLSWAMFFSFIVFVVNIIPTVRAPSTWYVDDEPGGTPSEDFTTIQAAVDAAQPGDTIYVYNGIYYENVVVNKTINLTGENRDYTIIDGGGNGDVVTISVDWVNITGFTIVGSGPGGVCGIFIFNANNTNISNNNVSYNSNGIAVSGFSNSINNNYLYSNNGWSAIWVNGNYNMISKNTLFSNSDTFDGASICLEGANNNTVINNTVTNNQRGIFLWYSSYNIISNNYCAYNQEYGIRLEFYSKVIPCEYNVITNNTFYSNEYGIYLRAASDTNQIYHNNIIHNANQTYDGGSNQWDNGYPSGGNFWSDYAGQDRFSGPDQDITGNDGIGDTNYSIDNDTYDHYPLMSPIGNCIFLYKGWNLVSIPFVQSGINLGEVLTSIHGAYKAVQWYNSSDLTDPWKHSYTTKPTYLNDLNTLDHTMGFWIFITEPNGTLFKYQGTQPISNQSIQLYKGWNMVGYPSLSSKNRSEALNNLIFDTHIDAIWTYNAATDTWVKIGPSDNFETGKGYRIHTTTDCVWQVPL